jgi:hypothetical protein
MACTRFAAAAVTFTVAMWRAAICEPTADISKRRRRVPVAVRDGHMHDPVPGQDLLGAFIQRAVGDEERRQDTDLGRVLQAEALHLRELVAAAAEIDRQEHRSPYPRTGLVDDEDGGQGRFEQEVGVSADVQAELLRSHQPQGVAQPSQE